MREIMTFLDKKEVDGFTVQPGFVGIMENGHLVAVTSGWEINNELRVYRKVADQWVAYWEELVNEDGDENKEVRALLKAQDDYKFMIETWLAVQCLNRHKPKILTRITKFWVNGRERTYRPIQGLPGVYKVSWWIDGERVSEIRALTVREYRNFKTI